MSNNVNKKITIYPLDVGHDITDLHVHFTIFIKCNSCNHDISFERELLIKLWDAQLSYVCGYGVDILEEYVGQKIMCKCGVNNIVQNPFSFLYILF